MEFAFERDAMNVDPLPKELDIVDSCLYVSLMKGIAKSVQFIRRDHAIQMDCWNG